MNRDHLHKEDIFYLDMCEHIRTRSKDPRTKVGAVIVSPDGRELSTGYNGFPPAFPDSEENWMSENKHKFVIHAELNALLNCPFKTAGCTLYCSHHPCPECVKSALSAGINSFIFTYRADWEKRYEKELALSQYIIEVVRTERYQLGLDGSIIFMSVNRDN